MFKAASKDSPPAAVPSNVTPTSQSSKAGKLRVTPEGGLRFVGDGGGGSGAQGKGSTPTNPQGEKQKFFATRSADGKWNLLMAPTSDPSRLFLVQPAPGHKFQVSDGGVRVENVSGAASHGSTSSGEASCTSSNGCVEEGSVIAGQESGSGEATLGTPKSIAVPVAQLRSSTSPHTITATTTSPTGSVTTTSASGDNVLVSTPREQKKSFFKSRTSKEREALKASVQHVVGKKVLSIPKRGTKSVAATDSHSKKGKKGSKSGKSSKSHSKSSTLPSSLQDSMSQSFSLMSVSPGSISNKTPSPTAFPATVTMSPTGCTDVVTTASSAVTSSAPVTSTSAISVSTSHQLTSSPSSSAQGLLMTSSLSPSLTSHGHQSDNISPPGSPVSDVPAASPKPVSPLSSQLSFTSPPSPEQTSQPTASCSRSRNSSVDRDGMMSSVFDIRSSSAKPLTVQIPQSDGGEDSGAENMGATASPSATEKQPLQTGDTSAEMPDKLSTEKPVKKSTKTKSKSSKAARRSLRGRPDNVSTGHQEHSLPHQDADAPTQSMEADEAPIPSITDPPRIGDAGDDNVDSVADFAAQIPKNDDPLSSLQALDTDREKDSEHVDADDSATEMEERYPRRNSRRSSAAYETHTSDKSESKRPEKEAKTKKTPKVDSPVKVPKGRASKKRSKTAEAPPDTGSDTDDYEPLIFKAKRTRRSSSKRENQSENTLDNIESEKSHDVVSSEQKTPNRTKNPVSDSEAATENQSKPETEKDPRTESSAGVDSDSGEVPRDQDISITIRQDQREIAGPSDSSKKQPTPCVKERDSRATRASRRSQEDSCTLQTEPQAENTHTVQQLEDSTTEASISAKQSTKKRKKRKSELEKLMEAQAALAVKNRDLIEEDKELVPMEEVAEEKLDESPRPDQEKCSVTGEEETDLEPEDNDNNSEPKEMEVNLAPTDSSPAEKEKDSTQAEKDSTPVEEERDSAPLQEENDSAPTEAEADPIPGDLLQTEKDSAMIDETRDSRSEEMLKNTPTQETGDSAFSELHKEDTNHADLAAEEPKTNSQEPQSSELVETFSEATEHESFHHEERKQKKKKKKKKKLKILINLTESKSKEVPDKDDEQSDVVSTPVPDLMQDTHEETSGDVGQPSGEVTGNLSTQESTMDTETHEASIPSHTVSCHGGKSKKKKRKKNKKLKIVFGSEHETSTREIPDSAVSDSNSMNAGDSMSELHQTDSLGCSHTFTDNDASNSNTAFDAAVAKPAKKPRRKRLTELEKIIQDQEAIARAEQIAIENQELASKTSEKGAEKETNKEETMSAEKGTDKDETKTAEKGADKEETMSAEKGTDKDETKTAEKGADKEETMSSEKGTDKDETKTAEKGADKEETLSSEKGTDKDETKTAEKGADKEETMSSEKGTDKDETKTAEKGTDKDETKTAEKGADKEETMSAEKGTDKDETKTAEKGADKEETMSSEKGTDEDETKTAEKGTDKDETKTAEKGADKEETMSAEKGTDKDETKTAEKGADKEETMSSEKGTDKDETKTAEKGADKDETKTAEKGTDKDETKTTEKGADKDETIIAEKVTDTAQTKRAETETDKEDTPRPEPETGRGESTTANEDNQGEEVKPTEPEPQAELESNNTAEVSASPRAETSREDTASAPSEKAVKQKDQEGEKGEKPKKKRKRKKKEPTVGVIKMPPLASGTDTDATEPMTDVDDVIHPIQIVSNPDVPLPTDLPSVSGDVEEASVMETDEDEDHQAKVRRYLGRFFNSRSFTRSELMGSFGMPYVVLEKLSEVDIYFMSRRFRNARVSSRAKCSLRCRQRTLQCLCELKMIDCTPLRGMKRPAGMAVPAASNHASSEEPQPKKKRGRKRKEHVEGEEKVKKKKRKETKDGEADKDQAASDESLVEIDTPASLGARPTTSFPREVILVSPGDKGFPVYETARPYLPPSTNTNPPRFPSSTVGRVVRLSVPVNPTRPSYTLGRPGAMTTAAGGPRFISLPSLATSGASSVPQVITLPALSSASSGVPRTIPPLLASSSASTMSPSLTDAMRATLTQAISSSLTKANPVASMSASPVVTTNQALNSALISALSGSAVSKGAVLVQAAGAAVSTAGTQGAVALNKQFFVVQMGDKRVLVPASALGTATTTGTGTTTTATTTSASTTAAALQSLFNSAMLRATAPSTIPTVVPESVAPPRPTPGNMARIVLSNRRPAAPTLSPRTGPTASSLLFANRPRLAQPNQAWAGPRTVLEGNRRVLVSPANQPQGIRVVISGASTLNTGSRFSVASSRGGVFVTSHPAGTSLVRMPAAPAKPGKRVMTDEERLRKRARLEKKYPLPPGVVIKTEPETFGYGGEGKTTQAGTTRVLLSTMGRSLASLGQPIPVMSATRGGGPIIIRQAAPSSTASPRSGSLLGPLIIRVPAPATTGAPRIAAPRIAAITSSVATSLLSSTARLAATATSSSSPTVVSLLSVPSTTVTSTSTTSTAATASTSVSSSALSTSSSVAGAVTSAAASTVQRPSRTFAAATTVPRPPPTVAAVDDDDDDAVYIVDSPPPPSKQASSSQKEKSQENAVSAPVSSAPSASASSTATTTAAAAAVVVSSARPQTARTSHSPSVTVTTASDTSVSTVTSTDVTTSLVATSTTSSALTTNAATASPATALTSSISSHAVSSVDEDINQDDVSDSQEDVTVSLPSDNTTTSSTSVTTTTTLSSTTSSVSSTTTTTATTTTTSCSVVEALLRGSPSPSISSPSSPMPSTSTALNPSRLVSLGAMFARQAAESGSLTSIDTRSLQSERMQRLKEALSKQMGNVSDERRQRALQALAQQFGRGGEGGARSGDTRPESPNTPSQASRESSAPRSVPSAGQSENNAVVIIDDNDAVDTVTGTDTRDGTDTDANSDTGADTRDGTDADTRDGAETDANNDSETDTRDGTADDSGADTTNRRDAEDKGDEDNRRGEDDNGDEEDTVIIVETNEDESASSRSNIDRANPTAECDSETTNQHTEDNDTERIGDSDITEIDHQSSESVSARTEQSADNETNNTSLLTVNSETIDRASHSAEDETDGAGANTDNNMASVDKSADKETVDRTSHSAEDGTSAVNNSVSVNESAEKDSAPVNESNVDDIVAVEPSTENDTVRPCNNASSDVNSQTRDQVTTAVEQTKDDVSNDDEEMAEVSAPINVEQDSSENIPVTLGVEENSATEKDEASTNKGMYAREETPMDTDEAESTALTSDEKAKSRVKTSPAERETSIIASVGAEVSDVTSAKDDVMDTTAACDVNTEKTPSGDGQGDKTPSESEPETTTGEKV